MEAKQLHVQPEEHQDEKLNPWLVFGFAPACAMIALVIVALLPA